MSRSEISAAREDSMDHTHFIDYTITINKGKKYDDIFAETNPLDIELDGNCTIHCLCQIISEELSTQSKEVCIDFLKGIIDWAEKKNASLNVQNNNDHNPLFLAFANDNLEFCTILLESKDGLEMLRDTLNLLAKRNPVELDLFIKFLCKASQKADTMFLEHAIEEHKTLHKLAALLLSHRIFTIKKCPQFISSSNLILVDLINKGEGATLKDLLEMIFAKINDNSFVNHYEYFGDLMMEIINTTSKANHPIDLEIAPDDLVKILKDLFKKKTVKDEYKNSFLKRLLFVGIKNDNLPLISFCLDKLNKQDIEKFSLATTSGKSVPISYHLCSSNKIEILESFINKGLSIKKEDAITACQKEHYDLLEMLFRKKKIPKDAALLHIACENNNYKMVQFLLDHGVNPDDLDKVGIKADSADGVSKKIKTLIQERRKDILAEKKIIDKINDQYQELLNKVKATPDEFRPLAREMARGDIAILFDDFLENNKSHLDSNIETHRKKMPKIVEAIKEKFPDHFPVQINLVLDALLKFEGDDQHQDYKKAMLKCFAANLSAQDIKKLKTTVHSLQLSTDYTICISQPSSDVKTDTNWQLTQSETAGVSP